MQRLALAFFLLIAGTTAASSVLAFNSNCPQPVLPGGIRPKNWSCPTGTQSVIDQGQPTQEGEKGLQRTDDFDPWDPDPAGPRQGEYDTAELPSGRAGGETPGRDPASTELRCGEGESIVGVQLRRGQVLDMLQIACASADCDASGCSWDGVTWGGWVGNMSGGHFTGAYNAHQVRSAFERAVDSGFSRAPRDVSGVIPFVRTFGLFVDSPNEPSFHCHIR